MKRRQPVTCLEFKRGVSLHRVVCFVVYFVLQPIVAVHSVVTDILCHSHSIVFMNEILVWCDDLGPTLSPTLEPTLAPTKSPSWKGDNWQKDGWTDDGHKPSLSPTDSPSWKDDAWTGDWADDGHTKPTLSPTGSPTWSP